MLQQNKPSQAARNLHRVYLDMLARRDAEVRYAQLEDYFKQYAKTNPWERLHAKPQSSANP